MSGSAVCLVLRDVDASVDDPVETWPTEALEIAMDRGGPGEWRRTAGAIRSDPWGPVAEGVDLLMERLIAAARAPAPS